jgi:uncharacterized protein
MIRPLEKNNRYRFLSLFFFITAFINPSFAQKNNPLINSGDLLKDGIALHDTGKYQQAIEQYSKISRSDTNYSEALYETARSYAQDSQFDASYKYSLEGIRLFPSQFTKYGMQAANILINMNKYPEALKLFDQAIAKNPFSAILYFNKAIAFRNDDKIQDAIDNLQHCILLNPYYTSAHYILGTLYLKEGNLIPAILAFQTYLMIAPSGRYATNAVQLLQDISKVTDDVMQVAKNKQPSAVDNFDLLQQILLSKISLDKRYKLKADLEDPIVRQIQVVNEKLQYDRNDKGFCMQYYVPLFEKLFQDNQFEPMIFKLFSGLNIKEVISWNNHNKKKLDDFATEASDYFNTIKYTHVLNPGDRASADFTFLYDDDGLIGKGKYKNDKVNGVLFSGPWEFYYDNGNMKAKGVFNADSKKEGEWNYYYDNGQHKEKTFYKDGEMDGSSEGWFDNGNEWYTQTYSGDKIQGEQDIYYYNGNIKTITLFKDDKKNGLQKLYDSKGHLNYSINYTNDMRDGVARSFYSDGRIEKELTYKNDKAEGTYKEYSDKGVLLTDGEYVNDLRQGLWTSYYASGAIENKITYQDNEITGEFTEYYENGKLSRKGNYTKKKMDGKLEDYDDDGKLYSDAVYDKGKLKEINFYDKSGNNISTTTTRRGAADITFYSPEGYKTSEGFYDKEGNEDGLHTFYYKSGKKSDEINYKSGERNGPSVSYYTNGQKKLENNYTAGDEDGYVKSYFANGKLNYEGWVVQGQKQQQFIYYNELGDTASKEYYLDDELNGYLEYKNPNNTPDCEYKYFNGWVEEMTQFDTTGKIISHCVFDQGKGKLLFNYDNGKKLAEGTYSHYMLNGLYKIYFIDGSLSSTSYYKDDERDSLYKNYYYGGAIASIGSYKDGDKQGPWDYYYDNGQLKEEEIYKDGSLDSVDKIYNADGTYDRIIHYKNGNRDGEYKIYGDNNELAIILYYKDDEVKSYSYEDKSGQLVNPVPIKKATGDVVGYYKNGIKSIEMSFFDNELEGPRKIYYTNGNIYVDEIKENGYSNGPTTIYYPDGTIWKQKNYVLGNLQGLSKIYYANGKLKSEENFYNDDNNGVCKYYNEQGNLKQTRVFFYGHMLSVQ